MIKVDERTYVRMAELAGEHGTTVGEYLRGMAGAERSRPEWTVVAQESEEYLREQFGFEVTSQELAEFDTRHAAIMGEPPRQVPRTGSA